MAREGSSLAHFRVFGCDSYVKVKDVARDKLDAKTVKCTFIGYGSDETEYRFWDSKGHKVVRSRDVTFNEDSLYGAKAAIDSSNLTKPIQKSQEVLVDISENLAEDINIVAEHGLSSEYLRAQWEKATNKRMCSFVKISAGKKASQSLWMFKVIEEQNSSERHEAPLSIVAAGSFLCGNLE
ncbi:retrovirus-related pol polyprotein from transposon TNT 1-94 [Tanacetum coccineum]